MGTMIISVLLGAAFNGYFFWRIIRRQRQIENKQKSQLIIMRALWRAVFGEAAKF